MIRVIAILIFTTLMLSCSPPQTETSHPIISAYSAAYNSKNIEAMAALMHPEIEWLSVTGDNITVEVKGKAELTEGMVSFFEDPNMATGSHKGWSLNGNYVAVTETAYWTNESGEAKTQSALTVYELEDNLIKRVYYYPAVK